MTTEFESEEGVREAVVALARGCEGPDRGRLARIEDRLLENRRRRSPRAWWWIVLGCGLAAGAAAGYWGLYGLRPADSGVEEERVVPAGETESARTDRADEGGGQPSDQPRKNGGDSPIIYMGQ